MSELRKLKCPICGTEFETNKHTRKYCSQECLKIVCRRRDDERRRKIREHKKELLLGKQNNGIVHMAVEARKAGLSYGQYVAREEYGARYE